jgi:cation transport regulator ChaC
MTLVLHPVHRHRLVTRIAKMKWRTLALTFVCLVILISFSLGLARSAFYPDHFWQHTGEETAKYLMILIDVRDASEPDGTTKLVPVAFGIAAGVAKLVLLVGLLGSVVFKFLIVPDVFQARRKASICRTDNDRWQMTLRIYNSTLLQIVDIEFSAYIRVPKGKNGIRSVPNSGIEIDKDRNKWPIAIPFVPFSVNITLDPDDVDPAGKVLRAIKSKTITPLPMGSGGATFLVLIVRGKRPELGTDIIETHWFRLSGPEPDYEFGKFEEIHVAPGEESKRYGGVAERWTGWDRFEMLQPTFDDKERAFIFGYGSLVSESNLERFLSARNLRPSNVKYCKLNGFHRSWNVAMDNSRDIPGYKYYVDEQGGERPAGFVSFLNIYRKADSFVNGIIFEVPTGALADFDKRELNYDRVDVTTAFDGKPDGRIWAYVAKEDGLERFATGLLAGNAMIDRYYRDEVERAFRSLGNDAYENFISTTSAPTVPVRNLRRIDIPKTS